MSIFGGVIFHNTHWTVWDVVLLFFVLIPLTILWFAALLDIFANHAVKPIAKVIWIIVILVVPLIGVVGYFIFRPTPLVVEYSVVLPAATKDEQLNALETMHHDGLLSDAELESLSGRVTGLTGSPSPRSESTSPPTDTSP